MRYRSENENLRSHIQTLRFIAVFLGLVIVFLWHGWETARKDARLFIPPDLRSGAMVHLDDPAPPNIYAFAHYLFQQANHWPENGEKDYGAALYRLSAFLTPRYMDELKADLDLRGKRGELAERIRTIQSIPGQGYAEERVTPHGNGTWTVSVDFHITEHVKGMPVKIVDVRYPIRVVTYDVNPEQNPFGLALDGYDGAPEKLPTVSAKR